MAGKENWRKIMGEIDQSIERAQLVAPGEVIETEEIEKLGLVTFLQELIDNRSERGAEDPSLKELLVVPEINDLKKYVDGLVVTYGNGVMVIQEPIRGRIKDGNALVRTSRKRVGEAYFDIILSDYSEGQVIGDKGRVRLELLDGQVVVKGM